jgi:16S rRNA (cytidine1402-2'-O)-methyltransferase
MSTAAKLLVVATPIGNLGDLSERAKIALREADVVCAEDTRHTRPLLDRIGATRARMLSVHAHNERERAPEIVALLEQQQRVCFVSDAGCPGISDPGSRLVEALVQAGVDVEVLPGPSALTTALMGAGIDMARFAFLGFLPRKG